MKKLILLMLVTVSLGFGAKNIIICADGYKFLVVIGDKGNVALTQMFGGNALNETYPLPCIATGGKDERLGTSPVNKFR